MKAPGGNVVARIRAAYAAMDPTPTIREIEKRTGVARSSVHRLLFVGKPDGHRPHRRTVQALAEFFGVDDDPPRSAEPVGQRPARDLAPPPAFLVFDAQGALVCAVPADRSLAGRRALMAEGFVVQMPIVMDFRE